MGGPWEKFAAPADGPWTKFAAQPIVNGADAIPLPSGARDRMAAESRASGPQVDRTSAIERVGGLVEPVMTALSGIGGGLAGSIAGLGKSLFGGKLGTAEGVQQGDKFGGEVANALTYQPRTETGKDRVRSLGELLNDSGIVGIPLPELNTLSRAVSSGSGAVRNLAQTSAEAQGVADAAVSANPGSLRDVLRAPTAPMAGGGAAVADQAAMRAQRAASLPVPIQLTKGQQDRTFGQVQFEREAAKTPEGKAINDRYADQNRALQQNFESMADDTGMQASGPYSAGKGIVEALMAKKNAKKAEISTAYQAARDSGDMEPLVPTNSLLEFVDKNRSAARNAPILSSIEDEVNRLSGGTGQISINDMEELRKMVGNLAQPGTPNAKYGGDAIRLIDSATLDKGGPMYQQARRLFENYSNEFTNRDVVDKILRMKPGTKDRAVAYEDVFNNSILTASADDVRHLFRSLQAHPANMATDVVEAGQQAARELRGAAVNYIKDKAFSNAGADVAGNVVGSEAKLKRAINELDKDGRLDIIFGKQGAQQMRDIRDIATDLYTSPTGTVNSSNNANRIVAALDKAAGLAGSVPGLGGALKWTAKRAESKELSRKVDQALNPIRLPSENP